MTADEIKALVGILREDAYRVMQNFNSRIGDRIENAIDALESLTLENQRLRLEFRADCEEQAEELFAVQRDAERYRWLRNLTRGQQIFGGVSTGSSPSMQWFEFPPISPVSNIMRGAVSQHLDEAIDAARSKSEEDKP